MAAQISLLVVQSAKDLKNRTEHYKSKFTVSLFEDQDVLERTAPIQGFI